MGKAVLFLIALTVFGVGMIVLRGAAVVAPSSDESANASSDGPSLPDVKIKENAAAAGEKIKSVAKDVATKNGVLTEVKPTTALKLDRELIEVARGGKVDVKVTRSGGDMRAETVQLLTASGSKVSASGGAFKQGQPDTVITVAAEDGAQNTALTLKLGTATKIAAVKIKN